MEFFKKNIILQPANYNGKANEKGILTLEKKDNLVKGTLKTFNLPKLSGKMLLAVINGNNHLNKFDVTNKSLNKYEFKISSHINNNEKISCVLVNIHNNFSNPVIWGSTETNKLWKSNCMQAFDEEEVELKAQFKKSKEEQKQIEVLNNKIDKAEQIVKKEELIDQETLEVIDEEMQKLNDEEIEANKPYEEIELKKQQQDFTLHKNTFTAKHAKAQTNSNLNTFINHSQTLQEPTMFYDEVRDQIESLFDKFETEDALEQIIPNSKFVKVDLDGNGDFYIFGLIYDENQGVEYIVYGVPALYTNEPPNEFEGFYQWLPLDVNAPEEEGYWLMYQDAKTGEQIKIQMV